MSTPVAVDRPFRADLLTLDPPRLQGSHCTHCATTVFPPRDFCPGCRSGGELQRVALSDEGRICSFTVVRQAPDAIDVPYVLAQIDLPADGVRLMATVVGAEPEDVVLDMRVNLETCPFGTADDGAVLLGYRFRATGAEVAA
ncbi:Zn-ribbon domain-containing OB-fold protein [Actinomycetospora sp. CA-053990]|uniref:Zn-ribbon domain-containing OB-fold protein n=1 Tax=Actinomycetospora sp. CA-053990 TaxID=3239891 RepID=UPI003D8CBE1E